MRKHRFRSSWKQLEKAELLYFKDRDFWEYDLWPTRAAWLFGKGRVVSLEDSLRHQINAPNATRNIPNKLRIKAKCHKFKFPKCTEAAVKAKSFVGFCWRKTNNLSLEHGPLPCSQHGWLESNPPGLHPGPVGCTQTCTLCQWFLYLWSWAAWQWWKFFPEVGWSYVKMWQF